MRSHAESESMRTHAESESARTHAESESMRTHAESESMTIHGINRESMRKHAESESMITHGVALVSFELMFAMFTIFDVHQGSHLNPQRRSISKTNNHISFGKL